MADMKFSRRDILGLAAVAASVAVLPASAQAQATTKPTVIRLFGQGAGYGKPFGSQAIGILKARELLEQEFKADGIRIEWTFPSGTGPAINEAIANGQADFANYGGLPNIVGKANGLPTRILASYGTGHSYLVVRAGLEAKTVKDLKGKKIAISRGTINHLTLNRVLNNAGLTEADIQLFNLKNADQISAITAGEIDATWGGSPLLGLADKGIVKVLHSSKDKVNNESQFGSFIVTESFSKAWPDITRRVLKRFVEAALWGSDPKNRESVLDIWALNGTPREDLARDYAGVDLGQRLSPLIDDFYVNQLREGIDFGLKNDLIREKPDLDAWIDSKSVAEVIRELGATKAWTPRKLDGTPAS